MSSNNVFLFQKNLRGLRLGAEVERGSIPIWSNIPKLLKLVFT